MAHALAAGAIVVTVLSACSGGGAEQLLETARFEELQRNLPHARKLYQQILERYAGTPQAEEARARLAAIGASEGTPAAAGP
ncbi:MAG: hypothetical protein FJ148_10230 [Deltaproteobacteria bacterium]|nr:hypothetical protein [Deltaproteobacteria bacterium]